MSLTKRHRQYLAFICITLFSQFAIAQIDNLATFNFPGGVVELQVPKITDTLPIVKYGIREPVIIQQREAWKILIGIGLDTLPGEYLVYIKHSDSEIPAHSVKFEVVQKAIAVRNLGNEDSKNTREIIHDVLSELNFSNTEQPKLPFKAPIAGNWEDNYGQVSASEDQDSENVAVVAQNYVSLTTTELATISAPQNAIVSRIQISETSQLATVFLDHGRGLYSILSGVDDLSVEIGNGIVAGAVIGKLPAAISDGPPAQLIWQAILNGVYINPLILTRLD